MQILNILCGLSSHSFISLISTLLQFPHLFPFTHSFPPLSPRPLSSCDTLSVCFLLLHLGENHICLPPADMENRGHRLTKTSFLTLFLKNASPSLSSCPVFPSLFYPHLHIPFPSVAAKFPLAMSRDAE